MMREKCILLGVTGSIAAYKIASLTSALVKEGAQVHVLMTENATQFISPLTFETLTGQKCLVQTFDRNFQYHVAHVELAKQADLLLIAPASADVIGKLAHGIADDMLTTTALACQCPILLAPTMNTRMYENPVVQDNLQRLKNYGMHVLDPQVGYLACREVGAGKMPEPETLFEAIALEIAQEKDLSGRKIMVTAGPTQESLDPVRFISNHSSGKMGYALAKAAAQRGAVVTLISGPVALKPPMGVTVQQVLTAQEMFEAVTQNSQEQDIIIKAAAVADYRPAQVSEEKIKKDSSALTLTLEKTRDILQYLGDHKRQGQILCGFSMETQQLIENSREKLRKKNLDLIVANDLKTEGAGFAGDTNVITLITRESEQAFDLMSKEEAAHKILDCVVELLM